MLVTLRGHLLVAEPTLADPNFHRSVVLLLDHGAQGALGVVLNRPGDVPVRDVVPTWAPYVTDPATLFVGGPVSTEAAICLARCPAGTSSPLWTPIDDLSDEPDDGSVGHGGAGPTAGGHAAQLGVIDLHGDPTDAPAGVQGLRIFGGYAGWSAGQLETELALDGWLVLEAEEGDVFSDSPERLWRRVLSRQRGPVRRFAAFPADPSLN